MTSAIDPHLFKQAMRRLAGGVSVVTVGDGQDRSGFTATSVTSLSAEPPRLLLCLNRNASAWPVLSRYKIFGVNLLHADQQNLADQFAGRTGAKGVERFSGARWIKSVTGAPLLENSLASLDCSVEEIIERHSHAIIIGRVEAAHIADDPSLLFYWLGDYKTLSTSASS